MEQTNEFYAKVAKLVAQATDKETGKITQQRLADVAGVNASYVSQLARGIHSYGNTGKPFPLKVYQALNRVLTVREDLVLTQPYLDAMAWLKLAKSGKTCGILTGDAGSGKSNALAEFQKRYPGGTFIYKAARDMNALQTVKGICDACGLQPPAFGNRGQMRVRLTNHLLNLTKRYDVILIIDEAENLSKGQFIYDTLKALYDSTEDRISIVLVGANHYYQHLQLLADRVDAKNTMPQFFSRFKSSPCFVGNDTLRDDAADIFEHFGIAEGERDAILADCDTYRDLFKTLRKREKDAKVLAKSERKAEKDARKEVVGA